MENLEKILTDVGLSKNESLVYLSLLELGISNVSKVAKLASIKRPTAYLILDELRMKGLIVKIPGAKKVLYKTKDPNEFFIDRQSKLNHLKNILPQLRSLNLEKSDTKTLYFEGISELKEALYYKIEELNGTEIIGFWSTLEGVDKKVLDILNQYNKEVQKRKIRVTSFTPDDKATRHFDLNKGNQDKDVTFIDENLYNSKSSIEVTDLYVRIIDFFEKNMVIIENPKVAHTLKSIFNLVSIGLKKDS